MYLSYSGFKTHMQCPRMYWHKYIAKTKTPKPDNRVNSLYGSVIGTVIEVFYNDKLWKLSNPVPTLIALVDEIAKKTMAKEVFRGGAYDWADPKLKPDSRSLEKVLDAVKESIPQAIEIIRQHRLIGVHTEAERELDLFVEGHRLGGRADFIMRRIPPFNDLLILDGKGSKYRDKYVDVRQLYWYAMLYQLGNAGESPDMLGFIFWRQVPDKAVDWVPFDQSQVQKLRTTLFRSIGEITSGTKHLTVVQDQDALDAAFPAYVGDKCSLCSFSEVCVPGAAYLKGSKSPTEATAMGVEEVE